MPMPLVTLISISLLNLILRISSLSEPLYKDDISFYLTLGKSMMHGAVLFKDITDITLARPGLMYAIAGLCGNLTVLTLVTIIITTISGLVFLFIIKELTNNHVIQYIAGILFVVFTATPLFEGNEPRDELFMMVFTLYALLLFLKSLRVIDASAKDTFRKYCIIGVLSGLAVLIKIHASFNVIAFIFVLFIIDRNSNRKYSVTALISGICFSVLLFYSVLCFQGLDPGSLFTLFKEGILFAQYNNQGRYVVFDNPYGKLFAASFFSFWVYMLRNKLNTDTITLSIWSMFTIMSVLLLNIMGSHYTLLAIPAIIFLFVIFITNISILSRLVVVIPVVVYLFGYTTYKNINKLEWVISYYRNFALYADKSISKDEYNRFFSDFVLRNYSVAEIIKTHVRPNDNIFVWGIYTDIYILSNTLPSSKYVWHEHIFSFKKYKETIASLETVKPKMIITFNESRMTDEQYIYEHIRTHYDYLDTIYADNDKNINSAAILYLRK